MPQPPPLQISTPPPSLISSHEPTPSPPLITAAALVLEYLLMSNPVFQTILICASPPTASSIAHSCASTRPTSAALRQPLPSTPQSTTAAATAHTKHAPTLSTSPVTRAARVPLSITPLSHATAPARLRCAAPLVAPGVCAAPLLTTVAIIFAFLLFPAVPAFLSPSVVTSLFLIEASALFPVALPARSPASTQATPSLPLPTAFVSTPSSLTPRLTQPAFAAASLVALLLASLLRLPIFTGGGLIRFGFFPVLAALFAIALDRRRTLV